MRAVKLAMGFLAVLGVAVLALPTSARAGDCPGVQQQVIERVIVRDVVPDPGAPCPAGCQPIQGFAQYQMAPRVIERVIVRETVAHAPVVVQHSYAGSYYGGGVAQAPVVFRDAGHYYGGGRAQAPVFVQRDVGHYYGGGVGQSPVFVQRQFAGGGFSQRQFGGGGFAQRGLGDGLGAGLNNLLSPQGLAPVIGAALGAGANGGKGGPLGAALGAGAGQLLGGFLR